MGQGDFVAIGARAKIGLLLDTAIRKNVGTEEAEEE
jgi:hypothetical protein